MHIYKGIKPPTAHHEPRLGYDHFQVPFFIILGLYLFLGGHWLEDLVFGGDAYNIFKNVFEM